MSNQTNKTSIYSKLNLFNCLNEKEIKRLNNRYYTLGLCIKQVKVDQNGNEINKEKPKENVLGKKRLRKGFNALDHFLYSYYGKEKFVLINQSLESESKLFDFNSENSEDKMCPKKCLRVLIDYLNSIKVDCDYMANKNYTYETDEYKAVILKYIAKFKKFLTDAQYNKLQNKWKNELLKVKGTDLFNFDKINDIINWKVSILKCFKSEIILYAFCNIFDGIISGKKIETESGGKNVFKVLQESFEDKKEKDSKSEEDDINEASSDSDLTEKTLDENMINS